MQPAFEIPLLERGVTACMAPEQRVGWNFEIKGIGQHNSAVDRIRISLLAVDTHGCTNPAMTIAKLLGFDRCPRLRDLVERKL